ncbi:BbrUII/HgiDII family restriction enzyme [Salinigranum halophilum]|uniref:BbrUII/HgiDII family restriction enzyme n=1 Tax=Salinigranum halophilum TaxID=2565931 RepID=UPI0010A80FC5|nr:ATP-binding protein [Salinigranum halophilum]
MSLSLNVLNHLGLNLYSNVPAVLSEAVANAWDADAENVSVDIDPESERIVITDDGHGMDAEDINDRYLHVGYRRRQDDQRPNRTPEHGRPVMGRKGIGKLSLLSIAETVEVYTVKNGDRNAFRMDVNEIKEAIGGEETASNVREQQYRPTVLQEFPDDLERGTKIVLTDLTKRVHTTENALRKRLARRFSVLGSEYDFAVTINRKEVTVTDRDYFHKIQFLWTFEDDQYLEYCRDNKLEAHDARDGETETGYQICGWIGTVEQPSDLVESYPGQETEADDLNKISLMVRGRMAKPDLLESFNDSRMFTKYLVGELHADFLDYDEEDDIATSSREDIVKEDPRYQELLSFLRVELNHIAGRWNDLRNQRGSIEARRISAVDMWYESLEPDNRERAKNLFGKINQITVDDEEERKELFKHGVFAFENLKYKENLESLNDLQEADMRGISRALSNLDDIESSQYHQMVTHRRKVVEEFARRVEEHGMTAELYDLLVDHPWLLNPSWERSPMDDQLRDAVQTRLTDDEQIDEEEARIKCVRTASGYTLVSLRHPTELNQSGLLSLVEKFRDALEAVTHETNGSTASDDIVFVIPDSKAWNDLEGLFEKMGVVVRTYGELLDETATTYENYTASKQGSGRISRLIEDIETGDVFD